MAFFKFGKKKKEDTFNMPLEAPLQPPMGSSPSSPVDQALMMKQQGYTNNQIGQMLQSQGYNNSQIYDAINQASLSTPQNVGQPEMGMPDYGQSYEQQYPQPPQQTQTYQPLHEAEATEQSMPSIDEERIQEVAEAIIDEKWEEFAADIKKVIEWKEKSEDRLAKLEQQLIDIRLSIDSLTKSIMGKISSYDQNIVDVGTEVKAMEKVFQKILPNLTESVNKLERMTKNKDTVPKK